MPKIKIDRVDKQILRDLQEDGRMSNVDLAKRANISAPPCLRRVRALEESGFIKGYHADLNREKLGYNITVFAQVALDHHSDKDLASFTDAVQNWEKVRECHLMTGDFDAILKIVAKDWDDYQDFFNKSLMATPNVSHVKSYLSVRMTKNKPGVPFGE